MSVINTDRPTYETATDWVNHTANVASLGPLSASELLSITGLVFGLTPGYAEPLHPEPADSEMRFRIATVSNNPNASPRYKDLSLLKRTLAAQLRENPTLAELPTPQPALADDKHVRAASRLVSGIIVDAAIRSGKFRTRL
jgi:hypothetical protein